MAHGNVIALGIVFDEEFPVEIALQGSNRPKGLHLGKAVVTRFFGSCGHQVCDTLPFRGKANEDEPHPLFKIEPRQTHFRFFES